MKHFIIFFVLCITLHGQAADTGLVCFTKKQVYQIATCVKTLEWRVAYLDTLQLEQSFTVAQLESSLKVKDTTISRQKREIALFRLNEELHAESERKLRELLIAQKPTIFQSPVLWAVLGLGTGYLLFHQ